MKEKPYKVVVIREKRETMSITADTEAEANAAAIGFLKDADRLFGWGGNSKGYRVDVCEYAQPEYGFPMYFRCHFFTLRNGEAVRTDFD